MARPTLPSNVKFRRLVRRLDLPAPYVRGLLETLWDTANATGNPVLGNADDVEAAADWPGEAGALLGALVVERLLDEVEPGRFEVHDYWHHAPEYVRRRRLRELARETHGEALRERARSVNGRSMVGQRPVGDEAMGHTPTPAPSYKDPPISPRHGSELAGERKRAREGAEGKPNRKRNPEGERDDGRGPDPSSPAYRAGLRRLGDVLGALPDDAEATAAATFGPAGEESRGLDGDPGDLDERGDDDGRPLADDEVTGE